MGGSTFFTFSQKCLFTELEPIWVYNFNAILLLLGQFSKFLPFINVHPEAFWHPKTIVRIDFGKFSSDRSTLIYKVSQKNASYWGDKILLDSTYCIYRCTFIVIIRGTWQKNIIKCDPKEMSIDQKWNNVHFYSMI